MGALLCGATFGALGACATDRFGTTSSRFTLGNQRIAAFGNGHMIEAVLGETGAVAPMVSDESGARGDASFSSARAQLGDKAARAGRQARIAAVHVGGCDVIDNAEDTLRMSPRASGRPRQRRPEPANDPPATDDALNSSPEVAGRICTAVTPIQPSL